MRITNKIMQNNNLSNINTNKIYQDKLSNQMSTQKKINRPSDDPVVAIRALRLRSSVTEITQYYSKNIPDAESWLSVTEDALKNLSQIMTSMISQCTKGSNGDVTTEDRQIILEQLKALGEEVYATGDADYAGRYVFTGYRTDTTLSFEKEQTVKYTITEQLDKSAISSVTKVNTDKLLDITAGNYMDSDMQVDEQDITSVDAYRFRLAYNNCLEDGELPSVQYQSAVLDENGNPTGTYEWKTLGVNEGDPTDPSDDTSAMQQMHSYEDPYTYVSQNEDALVYVPETGEILLGKTWYDQLMQTKDDDATAANEAEIRVTYQKESWEKGDLRPEHYFACESNPGTEEAISFNASYLTENAERQDIEYDVGFNQTIRVNSTADECFQHGIGREVDDLVNSMQNVLDLERVKTELESLLKKAEEGSQEETVLKKEIDAVEKALTYAKDKEQRLFERGITAFQGYLDDANLCITNCGTRSSKLSLVKNRMQNQKTSFETLKSENEDVDITEVAIQLTSTKLTYEAALMATGKVSQTTLLNYI